MKNITSMVDLYKITSVNLLINLKQLLTPKTTIDSSYSLEIML